MAIFYSTFKSNGNVIIIVTELLLKKCNCNCNNYIFGRSKWNGNGLLLKSNVYMPE